MIAISAKRLNIIHIPSWYPTESNPIAGIFVKEYIEGIAAYNPEINHIILTPIDAIPFLRHSLFKKRTKKEAGLVCLKSNLFMFNTNLKLLPKISRQQYWKLIKQQFKQVLNLFEGTYLIHSHVGFEAGLFARKLKLQFNINYIITEHMSTFPFPHILKNKKSSKAIKQAFLDAKEIISVSHNQSKEIFSFTKCDAIVIPNSINKHHFSIKQRADINQKVTFLTIGIPSHQKAIDILLQAIQLLDSKIREKSKFIIAGGGALLSYYKDMVAQLELTDVVQMVGEVPRTEIPQIIKKADVFVLVSRHESFGIVYIEALASGLPIIASKNGGALEIVNSKNGVLVNIEDVLETKNAIQAMHENYKNYDPYEIRKDFESRFSQEVAFARYIEIYKDLS